MANKGFVPYIKRPTRFESGSCLDHIFVKQNVSYADFNSFVLKTHVTDHCLIMLQINHKQSNNLTTNKKKNVIKTTIDTENLINLLRNHNWENVTNSRDVNIATDNFINTFETYIEKSRKTKLLTIKKN